MIVTYFVSSVCFRYRAHDPPVYPKCKHFQGAFECRKLSIEDIQQFHDRFYISKKKIDQDTLLLKYCQSVPCSRVRPKNNGHCRKLFQTKYSVPKADGVITPVCMKSFQAILKLKRTRIETVMKNHYKTGLAPKEKRGGDNWSSKYVGKTEAIVTFIKTLECESSHYCRGSSKRQYLKAGLSINKLFRFYNNQASNDLKVKRTFFFNVFTTKFNLGFGHPVTDACSFCIQKKLQISTEKDEEKRNNLLSEQQIHKLRAKAFFELVREKEDSLITFCFDCQKNLPLPKIPDQICYYKRQLYLYNFTITIGCSKDPLGKENVFSYTWTEDEFKKGSNEIASALYHRLKATNYEGKSTVRLIADGCAGQNKNSTVISACGTWLLRNAPTNIKLIELIFPGQSLFYSSR